MLRQLTSKPLSLVYAFWHSEKVSPASSCFSCRASAGYCLRTSSRIPSRQNHLRRRCHGFCRMTCRCGSSCLACNAKVARVSVHRATLAALPKKAGKRSWPSWRVSGWCLPRRLSASVCAHCCALRCASFIFLRGLIL